MTWDAIAWARSTGVAAGAPRTPNPPGPMPEGGVIAIERASRLARVQPTAAIGPVELELRAAGWTLGPLPEASDRTPVVSAIATDQSLLAGSGPGFASLRYDESSHGVRLRIRPVPEAQAGCAVLLPDLPTGFAALRRLAQDGAKTAREQLPKSDAFGAGDRLVLAWQPVPPVVLIAPNAVWPGLVHEAGRIRTDAVPVPPPRA